MTITLDYLVREVIKRNKSFKTIKYNKQSNKIEMNGLPIHQCDYDDILNACKKKYPDVKFKKLDIKNEVMRYAKEHSYENSTKRINEERFADWYKTLKLKEDGNPDERFKFYNLIAFFSNYPKYIKDGKSIFAYNEFTRCISVDGKDYEDIMLPGFKKDAELELGLYSNQNIIDAITHASLQNSFHPFKEALENVLWDGQERVKDFFIKYLGVENTKLNQTMTTKWFYALIKRLYEPGCDFDNMLTVFDQTQGTGKSKIIGRLVESLGVNYGYSYNIDVNANNKETVVHLNQVWVQVIDELAKFIKKDPEEAKQFFSMNQDVVRLPYGRTAQTYPRHCVFYGCTNVQYFLKDYSTNSVERRYWVMDAKGTPHDSKWWDENLPYEYCRQVLAEAKYMYDNDKHYNYKTLSLEENAELARVQDKHKTYREDTNLQYALYRVLDGKYSKETFDSYEDFYREAQYRIKSEDFSNTETSGQKQISFIPTDWIKTLFDEVGKRHMTTQYMTSLIKDKWSVGVHYYPGRGSKSCFIRHDDGIKNRDGELGF